MTNDVEILKMFRGYIIGSAMEYGMSFNDAEHELDALISGNTGTYTARIRSIIERLNNP